jgi:hypothetical protein
MPWYFVLMQKIGRKELKANWKFGKDRKRIRSRSVNPTPKRIEQD